MKFTQPIIEGRFIKRYKRFFADIQYQGKTITAHVPNTGSLKGCLSEGACCRLSFHDDPKRKLKYTLQMIKVGRTWVGVNTSLSNSLVWEAFNERRIPYWRKFQHSHKEMRITPTSRIDFAFWEDAPKVLHFVEVKNVTLKQDQWAQFPDAVTSRGQKHLQELISLVEGGESAEIFFTVQRSDCQFFLPADEIDPEYGRLLREANKAGVRISAHACKIKKNEISLDPKRLRIFL